MVSRRSTLMVPWRGPPVHTLLDYGDLITIRLLDHDGNRIARGIGETQADVDDARVAGRHSHIDLIETGEGGRESYKHGSRLYGGDARAKADHRGRGDAGVWLG